MPFDEAHDDGGGPDGPHNEIELQRVAQLSLLQLSLNCEAAGLCEFCAGIRVIQQMNEAALTDLQRSSRDPELFRLSVARSKAFRAVLKTYHDTVKLMEDLHGKLD